jgi:hypothetical protein
MQIQKINELEKYLQPKQIITGGHIMAGMRDEEIPTGVVDSFKYACELFKASRRKRIKTDLGILINDIGKVCSQDSCSMIRDTVNKDEFMLPKIFQEILEVGKIPENRVKLYWEKNVRNNASTLFKKILKKNKQGIIEINGNYWLDSKEGDKIILARKHPQNKYGIAACPLIVANFDRILANQGYVSSIHVDYVGDDNFCIPDPTVNTKSKKIVKWIGVNIDNMFVYLDSSGNISFEK